MITTYPRAAHANAVVNLLYHDVFDDRTAHQSGEKWDVGQSTLSRHLRSLSVAADVISPGDLRNTASARAPVLLTFDDGRVSAFSRAADLLEKDDLKGCFFIPTAYIDDRTHLTRAQVRELAGRGHTIGSHSWSHPLRISHLSETRLATEWLRSTGDLAQIIGQPIHYASVPGGDYSQRVAQSACRAGIRWLFTSEPTTKTAMVDECRVLGRFSVTKRTSERVISALARRDPVALARARWEWGMKRVCHRTLRRLNAMQLS